MRSLLFLVLICLASITLFAQSSSDVPVQSISTDSSVVYRLFATRTMYTFIKLNTRTGQMWQVQWNIANNKRFETTLSDVPLVYQSQERNGRFFLYPTTNIYTFILLDQINGTTWQVQWGKEGERLVIPIN